MNSFYVGLVVLVGIVATGLLLGVIFSKSAKPKDLFEAIDGTKFSREKDCNEYEYLYERLKFLYEENSSSNQSKKNVSIGLSKTFVQQIKTDGFANLNILISNKDQFKKLVELFDVSEMPSK